MKPNQPSELFPVSWDSYATLVDELVFKINRTGRPFERIYGIPRGGLVLGVMLSHRLRKPLELSKFLPYTTRETCLIADDIVDSGKAMKYYIEHNWFTASLFLRSDCPIKPTVYVNVVEDGKWVLFPYETTESTRT